MNETHPIKALLQEAPDHLLDRTMQPLIAKWSNPPKAIEILEVLDHCVHGALAASLIIQCLQANYHAALQQEGTTHEETIKQAHWRQP